jgi:hypothetical protein
VEQRAFDSSSVRQSLDLSPNVLDHDTSQQEEDVSAFVAENNVACIGFGGRWGKDTTASYLSAH